MLAAFSFVVGSLEMHGLFSSLNIRHIVIIDSILFDCF